VKVPDPREEEPGLSIKVIEGGLMLEPPPPEFVTEVEGFFTLLLAYLLLILTNLFDKTFFS
jgi:hypothetical protein